jgi:hypothetical protein
MKSRRLVSIEAFVLRISLAAAACSLLACSSEEEEEEEECAVDESYQPVIDPAKFVSSVDNPLYPLVVGTKWTYEAAGGEETIEIEVMAETKDVMGVTCTVVHDVAKVSGEVVEDTFDWYAQDDTGAVWYMGEDTKELSGGQVVSTEGSWEAGVDGAQPGYIIPPNPSVGLEYRQEYYACEAEDKGTILSIDEAVSVPAGDFTGCLHTHDYTPLEPEVNEEKYYCPGTGFVLAVDKTTDEREELVTKTP